MTHLANVLIAAGDADFANDLNSRLGRNGYNGRSAPSASAAMDLARQDHPDIILAGPTLPDMDIVAFAEKVKADPATADIPVVLIIPKRSSEMSRRALEAWVDDVIAMPFDDPVLLTRLRPLVRLATMHHEMRERAVVGRAFGITARDRIGHSKTDGRYSVLLVGNDTAEVESLLGKDADLTVTNNLYEAEGLVSERNFDAAVLAAGGELPAHLDLCAQIRSNPRLFNLPVVVIIPSSDRDDAGEAYRRGASRVANMPIEPMALKSAVLTLVRRQQLRWSIRTALSETARPETKDALTGTYNRDFLAAYLANRMSHAKARGRHLTTVFFNAPNIDGVRQQFGAEAADHLMQQLGHWITGLLRAEDMVARYGRNEYCAVLPDTPIEEADIVMHRIAGVLAYTDFAVPDVYQPLKVWVQVGSTAMKADDTTDTLIARSRRNMD